VVEVGAIRTPGDSYDVAILGGGLAGLTLAIQLKQARPETSVLVLEKREGPAPLAAFKVGESTVPAGAHYFADVVGMRDHLATDQLIKLGLRFFPSLHGNHDITKRPEKGPADFPPSHTYQIDRGLFENKLAARAGSLGVDVVQGARVQDIDVAAVKHSVTFEQAGDSANTNARWIVDASGRGSLLKRKLGLGSDCGHHINSAWFRLSGGLDLEQWGAHDSTWMARMSRPGIRKYSTNHLLGEGYWIWLIPLSTGPISIGVCADSRFHRFDDINSFSRMLEWLRRHEPQLADAVEGRRDDVEDFLRVEDFAYGVEQTFSVDRWALVGEAAAFADPFFSPGSDFIGYGNTFTTDLIDRDLAGEDISERVDYYNALYQRAFDFTIARYRDTYPLFGNPGVALEMLYWMTPASHSGMTLLFQHNKLTDLEFMKSVDTELERYFQLNITMHRLFRQWDRIERPEPEMVGPELRGGGPPAPGAPGGPPTGAPVPGGPPPGGPPPGFAPPLIVRVTLGVFAALASDLDDGQLRIEFQNQMRGLEELAVQIFRRAASALPEPPGHDTPIDPYSVSLDPPRWKADGLLAGTAT
jgi:flavin-dependent dehydrogenase